MPVKIKNYFIHLKDNEISLPERAKEETMRVREKAILSMNKFLSK
jgi:hypothetical protein